MAKKGRSSAKRGRPLTAAQRAERAAARAAKRKGAVMAVPEELAAVLGAGLNQTYWMLNAGHIPALKIGRRWFVSRKTLDRIVSGELTGVFASPSA
jgi:excisionase family DNA binding protein